MKEKVLNAASSAPNTYRNTRRYSNNTGYEIGPTLEDGTFYTSESGSSSSFDWGSFFTQLLSSGTSIVQSIWGNDNKGQIQGLQYINKEQQKTTMILWGIIALMLVLGIVLVIKKTK